MSQPRPRKFIINYTVHKLVPAGEHRAFVMNVPDVETALRVFAEAVHAGQFEGAALMQDGTSLNVKIDRTIECIGPDSPTAWQPMPTIIQGGKA